MRWADLPPDVRAQLEAYLESLTSRCGPFLDFVAREDAALAVEAWWSARSASGAAVREAVRRQYGRGRRPALRDLDRRQKRQAPSIGSLAELRGRLEPDPRQRRPASIAELAARQRSGA